MRIGPILLLASARLSAVGCSVTVTEPAITDAMITDMSRFSRDTSRLQESWQWTQTVCCYGNLSVRTPESSGDTERLVIPGTDTVEIYRNGSLHERTTLDTFLDGAQWGIHQDSLVVSWLYIDGPQHVYVRTEK